MCKGRYTRGILLPEHAPGEPNCWGGAIDDDSEDDFHTSCRNVSHCQQRDYDHPADNHAQMTLGFKLRLDCQSLFGKRARGPPLEASLKL